MSGDDSAAERAIVGKLARGSFLSRLRRSKQALKLVAVPRVEGALSEAARDAVRREVAGRIAAVLRRDIVDVVHCHGIDCADYLPDQRPVPMLATLHLPADWYPASLFAERRPNLWLNPVSQAQAAACPPAPHLLAPIENGVPVDRLQEIRLSKRRFALSLSRICPEKGTHLALDVADVDVPEDIHTLTMDDLVGGIRYILAMETSDEEFRSGADDIDHLRNTRVRAVGELLQNQ